ncbi:helix-turn-helix transcriptional regulator [Streptococcus sp. HF-1907]|uniref:XRE family transcriptional regulator n=1 Tax=Streptococcus sp. HF-1907 TaxID=2785793 RepID=UPI00189D63B9|nr:XRE family transcriptional regulator [Streptococcus sp. HF-1907]MBF7094289.1 helix-turn-helix transcriptional regulator [Streptococcus sp. HF-1907]
MSQLSRNIKDFRKNSGLTQRELAKKLQVAPTAISAWELGRNQPLMDKLEQMAQIFGVKKSELLGEYTAENSKQDGANTISNIYNELTESNKKKVIDFATILRDKQNRKPIKLTTLFITGFVSAGNGVVQDDYVDAEITIPTDEVPDNFDSVAKVIGESMAPKIKDGDLLFIKNTPQVDYNDIAVFQVNGENFVKQLKNDGTPYLKSLNPDYDDIILSEHDDIRTIGEVVSVYREN